MRLTKHFSSQITSNDVFLSRTTVSDKSTGAALCALFITTGDPGQVPHPIAYFPRNVLSSSVTYNQLEFYVRSRYIHPTMTVSKEIYEYALICEIRNV